MKGDVTKMNYDETIQYIQSKCKENIFRELDTFLTCLDDSQIGKLELENSTFKVEKNIIYTDFAKGIIECDYKVKIYS